MGKYICQRGQQCRMRRNTETLLPYALSLLPEYAGHGGSRSIHLKSFLATRSRRGSSPSPNGAQDDSPGQRPGFIGQKRIKPCKGETKPPHRQRQSPTETVPPFQGLRNFWGRKPRASLRFALGYHLSPFQGCGWLAVAHVSSSHPRPKKMADSPDSSLSKRPSYGFGFEVATMEVAMTREMSSKPSS